jgi:hypothetical protein
MAEEIQIPPGNVPVKARDPLGVVGLVLVTLGIYAFFWWYFINREMRDFGRARDTDLGQSPGNSVLAISLGALIIVPALVSLWRTSERLAKAQFVAGLSERASGPVTFLLLFLVAPVGVWYVQRELNKGWQAAPQQAPSPGEISPPQTASPEGSSRPQATPEETSGTPQASPEQTPPPPSQP